MRRVKPKRSRGSAPRRASTKAKHRTRKRSMAIRRLKPLLLPALSLAALASVAYGGYWTWSSGWIQRQAELAYLRTLQWTADLGLAVREVYVSGRAETAQSSLLGALDVRIGNPILAVDVDQAQQRIEQLGWVARATVERRFPATLHISLQERRAAAIWQRKGSFVLVDIDGVVIGTEGLERFDHLKVIVGEDAPQRTRDLLRVLSAAPGLAERVDAAVWVGDRRWNMRLNNGIDVRLPEQDPTAAWARLAELDSTHGILDKDIRAIDLRLPDRLVVRMNDGAAEKSPINTKLRGNDT